MQRLYTAAGEALGGTPWEDYPRPQLKREAWLCLNGDWELNIGSGSGARTERVRVPFCPESLLSNVKRPPEPGDELNYRRVFTLPEAWRGQRLLLHFGAISGKALVSLNGKKAAESRLSCLPLTLDVTELLREGSNELCVAVVNDLDFRYPWGKQRRKRGGMWYTPCSGLWQTVWLEPVPERHVRALRIEADLRGVWVEAEGVSEGTLLFEGKSVPLSEGRARLEPETPELWTPEHPKLYDFTLLAGDDRVSSYFALRTLTVKTLGGKPRLCLNGEPYFFHALLDQGYWSDGLYTPASPAGYEEDILSMKRLGFNTLRKHIKIEPERFYYDCDRLGMAVFQDMVNNGRYHYLRETVLPTVGFQWSLDRYRQPDALARKEFLSGMERTVRHLYNHPCVCYWTIFNEGWGQFDADAAYERLRKLDGSRFIDATSGWFHRKKSDVDSLHIYFKPLRLGRQALPQVLSEFGGYVWKLPEHSFNTEKTYGYKIFSDRESFVQALRAVYLNELVPLARQGLCAAVYTQLSDVEDETNGLVTFDRREMKLRPEELADVAEKLREAVKERADQPVKTEKT